MEDTLIVLAQSLEQPRIVKRINQKTKEYRNIHVYGFTRNVHSVDNKKVLSNNDNVKITVVGQLKNNQYLGRIIIYLRLLWRLYGKYGLKRKNLYVFGLDLRMFSFFLFNARVYYEISDIIWLYSSKNKRRILSTIDNFLARKSHRVVFTTKSFFYGYYSKSVDENNVIIEENKLETYGKVDPIDEMKGDKLRIAYIGAFRYTKIIERLIDVVSENKEIILNFYGGTHGKLIETVNQATSSNKNIFYHGPFKNPDDLEQIYGDNNLNFVVYDNQYENEKVAMPNKFYESGFFNIPIVCATKTYVGQRVLEAEMGWAIDTDFESISEFLNSITLEELKECHYRIKELNNDQFII